MTTARLRAARSQPCGLTTFFFRLLLTSDKKFNLVGLGLCEFFYRGTPMTFFLVLARV